MSNDTGGPRISDADRERVVAVAVDHVRLSYEYLDARNVDALGSLYAEDMVRLLPGREPVVGRQQLEKFLLRQFRLHESRHRVDEVIATGGRASVRGQVTGRLYGGEQFDVTFVDLFGFGGDGLLTAQQTLYFVDILPDGVTP